MKFPNLNPFKRSHDTERAITKDSFYGSTGDTVPLSFITDTRITPADMATVPAAWMAVREIAEAMAGLEVRVYDDKDEVVDRPDLMFPFEGNAISDGYHVRETQVFHLLFEGNSFSEIEQNVLDLPMALWPIPPHLVDRVIVVNGQKQIWIRGVPYTEDTIFHIPGISWNGIVGESPADLFGRTVNQQVKIQEYSNNFFNTGTPLLQLLSDERAFTRQEVDQMLAAWRDTNTGQYHPIVAPPLKSRLEPLGFPPGDSQPVEVEAWTVEQISRIFRIPRGKLNDSNAATYSNRFEDELAFARDCIKGIAERVAKAYTRRFLSDGLYYKFDLEPLSEPPAAEKADYYINLVNANLITREAAARELGISEEDIPEEEPTPEPTAMMVDANGNPMSTPEVTQEDGTNPAVRQNGRTGRAIPDKELVLSN